MENEMKRNLCLAVLLAVFLASGAWAEEVTQIIPVKYADLVQLNDLLSVFGLKTTIDRKQGAIGVRGPAETVSAFVAAVKKLDVPPVHQSVEVMVYMLIASSQASQPNSLPKELEPVVRQLRSVFSYKEYSLLETALARSRDGDSVEMNGVLPKLFQQAPEKGNYSFRMGPINVESDSNQKEHVIRINHLRLGIRVPIVAASFQPGPGASPLVNTQFSFRDVGISTDVDVPEGKKVVVGKANIDGSDDALVLVLTAKVVE
jgi:hypothetical protein